MSITMMVCFGIISLCTLVIGVSTVIVHVQDIKLKRIEEKNKKIHLLDFGLPSADEVDSKQDYKFLSGAERYKAGDSKAPELKMQMYHKWLPYCPDAFGFTKFFKCSKCNNVTEMHVLIDRSIAYYAYCPHCGSAMLHRVDE